MLLQSSLEAGQPIADRAKWPALAQDLKCLTVFSRWLNQKRNQAGAIDLSIGRSELKFKLDKDGLPSQAVEKEEMEIHSTIAELMILANGSVCALLYERHPNYTLCRIHPPPSKEKISSFQTFAKSIGLYLCLVYYR